MNSEERKLMRKKIEEAIAKTEAELVRLEEATQPIAPENSIGRVSRMDAINNKSVAEASLRTNRRKLGKLQSALQKVNQDDFGICSGCKKPIQPARLMYMPESTYCVKCAQRRG